MCPPANGWVKVKANGAADRGDKWSAAAGMLRDSNGQWIVRYQRYLGKGSTLNSELWAILHGIEINIRGYAKVVVESDCLVAVNMIKECLDGIPLNTIVRKIKVLVCSFEAFELNHV